MTTITITFCDQAENHVGMQKMGNPANDGFNLDELMISKNYLQGKGLEVELIDLNFPIENLGINAQEKAYILIARKGVDGLVGDGSSDELLHQLKDLEWDKKAYIYGRVVNKHARHNLCFGDFNQEPNYQEKKGRVIDFNTVPILKTIREQMSTIFGNKCTNLVAEGNFYHDVNKCGIGYHGDAERKIVIGVRTGETMPLVYQWYKNSEKIGDRILIQLNHGDIYAMSNKASGNDWKKKNIVTIRHAAGSNKYID